MTFAVFLATLVATGYLFVVIPKGFFPQQDTGLIIGTSEAAQDISFAEMVRRQRALGEVVSQDPAVATVGMAVGSGGGQTQNNGRFFITLKPRDQRNVTADQVIRRLQPKLAKVEGAALFLQVGPGHQCRREARSHAVSIHVAGRRSGRARHMGPEDPRQAEDPAGAARCRQRPADGRRHIDARPSTATRPRASASSPR